MAIFERYNYYWNIGDTPIFDFHDYGRKCTSLSQKGLNTASLQFVGGSQHRQWEIPTLSTLPKTNMAPFEGPCGRVLEEANTCANRAPKKSNTI